MAKRLDPAIADHLEWIGFVRPTGLVVSAPALVKAGVILNRQDAEGQRLLRECVEDGGLDSDGSHASLPDDANPILPDFRTFANKVLGWNFSPRGYAGTQETPIPAELEAALPDGGILRPDFAVRRGRAQGVPLIGASQEVRDEATPDPASAWQLLVTICDLSLPFDRPTRGGRRSGSAAGSDLSPHRRMERLLRETGVPAGLLFNGKVLRLISAPRGESSGWLDFHVGDMLQSAGRPISTAMRELLRQNRLLVVPEPQRLAALLENSRKYQNDVSERLAGQVLHALYELLRGFQAAHDASKGELLKTPLADDPSDVYRGLLTLILRLVFLLYTEERDMLPQDETFLGGYSLATLYERLREDAALHPDTMDQRYGAYAQVLVLSRMIHDGARCGVMSLPPRHGALFDPDRYRFLEGRGAQVAGARQVHERIEPPLVSDGTIYRVLEKLIVLGGERISYRALDVEHVGSVYETMMGFRLETASGRSVAIKAAKKHGAPATVNIEALLDETPGRRDKWLRDRTDRKLTSTVTRAVRDSESVEELLAALDSVIDKDATPDVVPQGAMILQPSEERRRSGSHYTPRELTEPIVRHTLAPILARLRGDGQKENGGGPPQPAQILDLKVCDPAMGSGAFLVEVCRQLADALVESWHAHGELPDIPPDENEVVFARRLIAQRCLYGLDRNPTAVDLAKLSLWLVTLAKDHPLTFLDHALRHGDALVGLSRDQIVGFHWKADGGRRRSMTASKGKIQRQGRQRASQLQFQEGIESNWIREQIREVARLRRLIREADDNVSDWELRDLWDKAAFEAGKVAFFGDLTLAAFFTAPNARQREKLRAEYAGKVSLDLADEYRSWIEELRYSEPPLAPFHWEIEFPEVFERVNPGFDAVVGNPPFGGHVTVVEANVRGYTDWLRETHVETTGKCDVVAHFFRRAFNLVRNDATFGLIATNTIAQGDTRSTGLRWICEHGGEIYRAQRRYTWPGLAAVVVSVVHVMKGRFDGARRLDGSDVDQITAFLFHSGGQGDPARLEANVGKSFQGSIVLGMGFTFDDTDTKGVATPLAEMRRLIEKNPRNREVILPYIGGKEVNTSPTHTHHRHVINFRDWPLRRADLGAKWQDADDDKRRQWLNNGTVPLDYPKQVAADWPELLGIVEARVKPERLRSSANSKSSHGRRASVWWQIYHQAKELQAAIDDRDLQRVLAISEVGQHGAFAFLPSDMVFAHTLKVFSLAKYAAFCALQSRPHETWARFFASSLEDRLRYTPSDCFETFPFPDGWETHAALEVVGEAYYDFRAALMVDNDEGLTETYNRFHDPHEQDLQIAELRRLHAAMDRAVLDAYGWEDIPTDCEFLLDHEIDEDSSSRKKKPWRYRWPDDVHDEVLACLLALNAERAAEEERDRMQSGPT